MSRIFGCGHSYSDIVLFTDIIAALRACCCPAVRVETSTVVTCWACIGAPLRPECSSFEMSTHPDAARLRFRSPKEMS